MKGDCRMIKLGVLGTGIITECHFFALDKIDTAKVAAIASLDEEEGKKACEHFGAAKSYALPGMCGCYRIRF